MGLIDPVVRNDPDRLDDEPRQNDSRLRSRTPGEFLAGRTGSATIVKAQALLALGAGTIGGLATALPHPPQFDVTGLHAVQAVAIVFGIWGFLFPRSIPGWLPRVGPALATVLTTFAVYFSGDSTSGFVMFYLWVGLYAFYFPRSRWEAAANVTFAAANYAVAIAITPNPGGAAAQHADINYFVIATGTLFTASVLLTYLRGRLERLMGRLTDVARTDPLTGLPNRVGLMDVLERETERARPERRPLSLLLVDIDYFKTLNERHGIDVGDQILQRLASLLESHSRTIDTVARSAGEEFAVILPEADQHRAFMIAEGLLDAIRASVRTPVIEMTASIGIASSPGHADGVDNLVSAADEALFAAKALGRDRTVIYSPEVTSTLNMAAGRRTIDSQAHLATVLSLAEALDQRDSSTARHSQTVGRLCEMMARALDLDDEHAQRVRLAGLLHDIGKIGVSDVVLRKPGPLTAEEQAQMRRHPELGARILATSELDDVRSWIVAHHERPDGTGYPHGLKGDEIPLEASILAVADAYEAMTADRVYRPALGEAAAQEELRRNAGTQFDGTVVTALLDALKDERTERTPAEQPMASRG